MTWVVPLALGSFAILLMVVFTMLSARKRHHALVAPALTVGPAVLVHDINDDRCTGCDACVAVCPTNVLDLVANKSRVLRFEDCIQCEACMFACPTEALVMFPEGTTPPPLKIPEIDENFQTAVPGQYLIGEVAGKPLVKNAANLGRVAIEHMMATGLRSGAIGRGPGTVDVAIVGSGPGGLSAALSCIQRGLSYVVLEKEQLIASTIARYPKGKLVMAEPYDTVNLSLLPVFDAAKEQLIPIWLELIDRIGLQVRQGESVEAVQKAADGVFDIRTTVGAFRAQRVVLSIGTRGKPRTLQVPGENLPKIFSLLEDPDEHRGRSVLVVGGGDSAVEAALALADAGARVTISYRGKGFNRAAPKNKQTIEAYAAEGRVKARLGSQVLQFDGDSVTLALADGSQKRYPNDAAFVLIGADPPVQWLEKVGIRFVERPHQHQMGKSDDAVRRLVARAMECPSDAARAAAQILGGSMGIAPAPSDAVSLSTPMGGQPVAFGPKKWLRSATSLFSNRLGTQTGGVPMPMPPPRADSRPVAPGPAQMPGMTAMAGSASSTAAGQRKKFDAPVPLSEFAMRGKAPSTGVSAGHSGDGRRDQLSAGERTRILRMLRDEGGRESDEDGDSAVYIGGAPAPGSSFDFDIDDPPVAPPPPSLAYAHSPGRPDLSAKPAVVIGLAEAQASSRARQKRSTAAGAAAPFSAPVAPPSSSARARNDSRAPAPGRRPVPKPFTEENTREVDDEIMNALRAHDDKMAYQRAGEATRIAPAPRGPAPRQPAPPEPYDVFDERNSQTQLENGDFHKFLVQSPATDPIGMTFDDGDEHTRMTDASSIAAMERVRQHQPALPDERTRAVRIREDGSMSEVDWDLEG